MWCLKSLAKALCLSAGLLASAGTAQAASPLAVSGGTPTTLAGVPGTFNPQWFGDASLYTSTFDLSSMLRGATLLLTQPTAVTYTLVGFEAGFNNGFVTGSERFNNRTGALNNLGATVSFSQVAAGALDFGFLSNGTGAVLGNGSQSTGLVWATDRLSALLLFNDAFTGDRDFDDMVVRITVSSVPEPEMLGMLLAGLGVVMVAVRRSKRAALGAA